MAGCGTEDWADDLRRIGGFHFEDSYKKTDCENGREWTSQGYLGTNCEVRRKPRE